MNKIIISIGLLLIFAYTYAQVGIETTTVRGKGLMDFPETATKGMILPKNTNTANSGSESGSLAFNVQEQRVEYRADEGWVPLTNQSTTVIASDIVAASKSEVGSGVILSNHAIPDGVVPLGVLELKSNDTALILPTVTTSSNLPAGEAGMICYIKDVKAVAVYNGSQWSFWK